MSCGSFFIKVAKPAAQKRLDVRIAQPHNLGFPKIRGTSGVLIRIIIDWGLDVFFGR